MLPEKYVFRISAGLKNIIGRELITDDFIAVFELVKNSYDAYADMVEIVFRDDEIVIRDNGRGMGHEDIRDKWLFVAYSAKKEGVEYDSGDDRKQQSYRDKIQAKRPFAGAKGIGRFSCDRLGDHLILKTKTKKSGEVWECLEVNWKDFDQDPKAEFAEIAVNRLEPSEACIPDLKHGTELVITKLSAKWSRDKKLQLKRSLGKLLHPYDEADDFSVVINAPEESEADRKTNVDRDKVNGPVRNFIFETLDLKTTKIETVISPETITSTLSDRGKLVYRISEPNSFDYLKNARIYIFSLNQAAKSKFTKYMGIPSVQFGSVFLFRNGFRVYPYGNVGADVFNLDRRKQQGIYRYLGTRDIIGRIELEDPENSFVEKTSRDGGLINSPAVTELETSFKDKCLLRLEKYVRIQWSMKDSREDTADMEGDLDARERIAAIVSKLASSKAITILEVGKDFLEIIDKRLEEARPRLFKDLEKIAKAMNDTDYLKRIQFAEKKYEKAMRAKEEAEAKAAKEKKRREDAEAQAEKARSERTEAEQARKEAELREREAKVKAREAEQDRKEAEEKAHEEAERARTAEAESQEKSQRILFYKSVSSVDTDNLVTLHHQIGLSSNTIDNYLRSANKAIGLQKKGFVEKLKDLLGKIGLENQKILQISRFATKANFKLDTREIADDLIAYMEQYIENVYQMFVSSGMRITFENTVASGQFVTRFRPIEMAIIVDNVYSNAKKAGAKHLRVKTELKESRLALSFSDDGKGFDSLIKNSNDVFEKGFTTTSGSGLGLFHVKEIVHQMGAAIGAFGFSGGGFCLEILFEGDSRET